MNGFNNAFGTEAEEISLCPLNSIVKRLVIAEYLQVFKYNGIKFWSINNLDEIVTMLLPGEY